ncbi:hypothetical protein PoB_001423300 [Plakobranchus ocellatus]|uniref:Secreted protein n=1 Tax=Plakobranchus ocellatus TaxID=259542 RepID=A0AAV3YZQ8_9GAST|nr:hypothetical protein PoB_001423300 [Plakobranchus ocellatus]
MTSRVASSVGLRLLCFSQLQACLIISVTTLASCEYIVLYLLFGLVVRAAMVSKIMRGHIMALPFPLFNRATNVRQGCKKQKIAPTLRQDENRSRLGVLWHQKTRVLLNMYFWTRELLSPVLAKKT